MISLYYVEKYCNNYKEIENYEKAIASDEKWDCHHKLETHTSDGIERPKDAQLTMRELKALDIYYNRPPEELIFLTRSEHISLHHKGRHFGPMSKESIKRLSEAHKRNKVQCIETGKIYRCGSDAEKETGIYGTNINKACQGKLKTAGGFHWRYYD